MAFDRGLLDLIERLGRSRVLVMGDIMLDRFIDGEVARISPEGPVPVLKSIETRCALGGAGNVARNLTALGVAGVLIAMVGADSEAEEIRRLLSELHPLEFSLIVDESRQSTVKTRFLARRQQLLRVDAETTSRAGEEATGQALEAFRRRFDDCDAVIVSDYGKGLLTRGLLDAVIAASRERRKPVLVDPKGLDYSVYANATILTPNLKELGEATRMPVGDDAEVSSAAHALIGQCHLEAVLATRSQDGMSLVEPTGAATHLRSEAREVFDVTGAGDTVIAVLGAAIAAGAPLVQCAELANIAAGIVVGKAGTAVTHVADLVHAIRRRELTTAEAKIMDVEDALSRIHSWRQDGRRIGFINGFFELLHPSHIAMLSQASRACDRLIVGINGDASVYRLKGEAPMLHEAARSAIVASLEDVDLVVIFQEDTPGALIEALKPDLLIKPAHPGGAQTASLTAAAGRTTSVLVVETGAPL